MDEFQHFVQRCLDRKNYPDWLSDNALRVLFRHLNFWLVEWEGQPTKMPNTEEDWKYTNRVFSTLGPYMRCFRDEKMKYCWDKIETLSIKTMYEKQEWFAEALWGSLPRMHVNPKTRTEISTWKNQTLKALKSAGDKLKSTPLGMHAFINKFTRPSNEFLEKFPHDFATCNDEFMEFSHFVMQLKATRKDSRLFDRFPDPSTIIDYCIYVLKNTKHDDSYSKFYGGNINGKDSKRGFFIRKLTCALLQDTGKPCRKLVAISTSVAFNFEISDLENYCRMIRRNTQNLDPDSYDRVVYQD